MENDNIRREKIELLEWLDGYEAWNEAFQTARDHHVTHDEQHTFYYFVPAEKKWKAVKSRSYTPKSCASYAGESIDASCYSVEFNSSHYHLKVSQPEFENIVTAIIEGSKNFIKRYYS